MAFTRRSRWSHLDLNSFSICTKLGVSVLCGGDRRREGGRGGGGGGGEKEEKWEEEEEE